MKTADCGMVTIAELPAEGSDAPVSPLRSSFSQDDLVVFIKDLDAEIQSCQQAIHDENDKRDMYKVCLYFETVFNVFLFFHMNRLCLFIGGRRSSNAQL